MRHMLVHDGDETIVMMLFDEMRKFVNDNVLQALYRFLYELEVQPDPAGLEVAGAPLCFHLFDAPLCDLNT